MKRLAIISDCVHMYDADGNAATENHIFRKQIESIAAYFESTVICCPFIKHTGNRVTTAYSLNTIEFIPVPKVGGDALSDKLKIIRTIPAWLRAYKMASAKSDIVFMRFPNNISIPAFFYFSFYHKKKFALYTGSWLSYKDEPLTYRFQKWILKKWFNGPVFIYTKSAVDEKKFYYTYSPSYTLIDWQQEEEQLALRLQKITRGSMKTPVFIAVGNLCANKNQQFILDAFLILKQEGFQFKLFIAGDGVLKKSYSDFINNNAMQGEVVLAGKQTDTALRQLYREADFLVHASLTEGFGKIAVEAFTHGVVPLLSNIPVLAELASNEKRAFLFSLHNPAALVILIKQVTKMKENLPAVILNGRAYAKNITLETFSKNMIECVCQFFYDGKEA